MNFKLRLDHDVFEDNPELRTIPEFSHKMFTDRMMKYVMLMEWHLSPLRLLRYEDRKYKAALLAGYKLEKDGSAPDVNMRNVMNGKVNSIEAALRVMREIQFDEDKDIDEAYNSQIREIVDYFKKPDKTIFELEKATKLMEKLPSLLENRKKVREILNFRLQDSIEAVENTTIGTKTNKSVLDMHNENN